MLLVLDKVANWLFFSEEGNPKRAYMKAKINTLSVKQI